MNKIWQCNHVSLNVCNLLQAILKLKLVPAILHALYPILCEESSEDDSEEFGEADANTASAFAGQVCGGPMRR